MKKITLVEQKKILVEMLSYIDKVCRENNIKYSLIGGSLIGAVRHKGIIPWDDDIDMILMPQEYDKLISILSKENSQYTLLNPVDNKKYYYPFAKLVDNRTLLIEKGIKEIDNYGVYVDIFQYHYVSNNALIRKIHYKKLFFIQTLFARSMLNPREIKNLKSKLIVYCSKLFGANCLKKWHIRLCNKRKTTRYLLSNWPVYGYSKEIQDANVMNQYIDASFENETVMITKNYDKILSTTFGDYMKFPPKEQRIRKHNVDVFWK